MLIAQMYRSDLVKIARASLAEMTTGMDVFVAKLIEIGQYAKATDDELEMFGELLGEMEAA